MVLRDKYTVLRSTWLLCEYRVDYGLMPHLYCVRNIGGP